MMTFAALAFVVYVVVAYPGLLALWARLRPLPLRRDPAWRPTVSVVLPVADGERWLAAKLETLKQLDYPAELLDITVVLDGCTDGSEQIVRGRSDPRIRVLSVPRGGKAAALNAGIEASRGEVLFLTDVRQPVAPGALREMIATLADPAVGAVSGELVILDGRTHEEAAVGLYWKYEKFIRTQQSNIGALPGATGAIYCIRRELTRRLPVETLNDDMYLPLCAVFAGRRVVLERRAVAWDYPTGLETEFRRKVRTLAGVYQIVRFFPALLWPGHRLWFHFLSHKLGRLLLPFALILAGAGLLAVPEPLRTLLLAGGVTFAALALIEPLLPGRSVLKRAASPVRTFAVLMLASLAAVSIWFRPARSLWKPSRTQAA